VALAGDLQEIREGFQPAFWVANITELFERLSYYGGMPYCHLSHETLKFSPAADRKLIGSSAA